MERHYGAWINLLAHKVKKRLNLLLADAGLTGVQSMVLHYILTHYSKGPVFQRDVEEAFELSRSTTTGILKLLEKNGVIRRESMKEDGRLKNLIPTEKAKQLDDQIHQGIDEIEALLTAGLSAGQLQLFQEIVRRMSDNLDE